MVFSTLLRVLADHSGKRHADVIHAIRNLDCSNDFRERNFALTINTVPSPKDTTREVLMCEMTSDGFTFRAVEFTGKDAAKWKEACLTLSPDSVQQPGGCRLSQNRFKPFSNR